MAVRVTCEKLFDGTRLHGPSVVHVDDEGTIVSVEPHSGPALHPLVSPGLVDVQMNGFGEVDVAAADADSLADLDSNLLGRGTTDWLGTIVTAPLDTMSSVLSRLSGLRASGAAPGMVGIHVEGPFLGGAPGAHRRRDIVAVDEEWLRALPADVALLTLAPEQTGAVEGTRLLAGRGTVVSLGHSTPTRAQYEAARAAGAEMLTHLFNGMSGVHHREGGLALWGLADPGVVLGLIADLVHVDAQLVSVAFAAAGPRVCLVSDSIAAASEWARAHGVRIDGGAPRLADGTLAGSSSTLAECVRNCVVHAGIDLARALAAATSVPARLLDRHDLGRISPGSPARLVTWDSDLRVTGATRGLQSVRARACEA